MKQLVLLAFALCTTTVALATNNGTHPNKNKNANPGGETTNQAKLQEAHKQVSLVNLAVLNFETDTVSEISSFGTLDCFRKATGDYAETKPAKNGSTF